VLLVRHVVLPAIVITGVIAVLWFAAQQG